MPHQTNALKRKGIQVLVTLLLLGGWSLALAASVQGSANSQRQASHHVQSPRVAPHLNVALPATMAAKLATRPVALDEPRAKLPNPAEAAAAVAASSGERPNGPGFDIRWRESREIVSPDVVSMIRNYRRDGLPVVHLYQSGQNLLAIGVNPHGLPGIYFTRHVGG